MSVSCLDGPLLELQNALLHCTIAGLQDGPICIHYANKWLFVYASKCNMNIAVLCLDLSESLCVYVCVFVFISTYVL